MEMTPLIGNSLEKDPSRRASPWRMLEHPWMIEMRAKRVNMAHFLATVWGWDETPQP
jgi:mitogen-activated protein kinase kinase